MSEIETGLPDSFSSAELVAAVGPLCRDDPGYWTKLVKTLSSEGVLMPLPAERSGTGVHRRYGLDETRLAAVLFHLKALGVHHSQLGWVARLIRDWLANEPEFAQLWNAAVAGERHELNIAPDANRGFDSEVPPWVGINQAGFLRDAKVLFTIRLDQIFDEMFSQVDVAA